MKKVSKKIKAKKCFHPQVPRWARFFAGPTPQVKIPYYLLLNQTCNDEVFTVGFIVIK